MLIFQKGWPQLDTNRRLSLEGRSQNMPLQIQEAFPYHLSIAEPGEYLATWNLAPGHYLYGHAFQFKLIQGPDNLEIPIAFKLPPGLKKIDQFFGDIEAFYGDITVNLTLPTVPRPEAQIIIEYQGCADWGFCYPPQSESLPLRP
tara:strand:- start:518 stop:952 length:435 start_codon:yes stop_codon:yes gene_type:complete